ncbi:MAG: tetratricopeptide repeat protein, partial [Terriglobia bacterium]
MNRTSTVLAVVLLLIWAPLTALGQRFSPREGPLATGLQPSQAAPEPVPPVPQAAKAPQWKSRAEYDAFTAIVKATGPQAKISAVDAFLAKFPNSDFKPEAEFFKLQAYQKSNQHTQAIATAKDILKSNPPDPIKVQALNYLAYVFPYVFKPGSPNSSAELTQMESEGKEGLQLLQQVQKPANVSQEQFEKGVKQVRTNLNRALGFAALEQKDDATAITYLKAAAGDDPNGSYIDSFLGQAYLASKPPDYNDALWYLARGVALAKAAGTPNLSGMQKLYDQWYEFRHGSNAGEQSLVAQADSSPNPPAGFKVATPPKHAKTGNPAVDAFYSMQDALSVGGNATQAAWNGYKGQPLAIIAFVESVSRGPDPDTWAVRADVLPQDRGRAGIYNLV